MLPSRAQELFAAYRSEGRLPSDPQDATWVALALLDQGTSEAARQVLSKKPVLSEEQTLALLEIMSRSELNNYSFPVSFAAGSLARSPLPAGGRPLLENAIQRLSRTVDRNERAACRLLEGLLGGPAVRLQPGERWVELALAVLPQAGWAQLLAQARAATSAGPSAKWLKATRPLLDKVGEESFLATVRGWFEAVGPQPVGPINSDVLRGLVHACALLRGDGAAAPLAELTQRCVRKGPPPGKLISSKVAKACVLTLAELDGPRALAAVATLKRLVKSDWIQPDLDAAEKKLKARFGEVSLPVDDLGLTEVGLYEEPRARLVIGPRGPALSWQTAQGRWQASVPADLQGAPLKARLKQVKAAWEDQRRRLEGLLLSPTGLAYEDWRRDYLDHRLVGALARCLVWRIGETSATWQDGLTTVDYEPCRAEGPVRLWHPAEAPDAAAWRAWLQEASREQPFPQVFREVCLEPPAEGAAISQNAFQALRAQLGWECGWAGSWGDLPTAVRKLPAWEVEARLEISMPDGCAFNDRGLADRVVLGRLTLSAEPPARVRSEIFRDVLLLSRA